MGEGFIVRRGGGGQQTVKPIFNSLTSVTFTSLTLSVTNDSNSIATLYYSVVNNEPAPDQAGTFDTEFDGKETKNITITGLTGGTTYTVYLKAIAIGEFPSDTVIVPNLTTGVAITATGGTTNEYVENNKRYKTHRFNSNGTFQITQLSNVALLNNIDYFIVAGGGAGGSHVGGGGGAGGLLTGTIVGQQTSYGITVGGGGTATGSNTQGNNGANSTAFSLTAFGGGGGGTYGGSGNPAGITGGSGGGAGGPEGPSGASGGSGTTGQGFRGGNTAVRNSSNTSGGGGGGASQQGGDRPNQNTTVRIDGGNGLENNWLGTNYWFAGGGGSGTYINIPGGFGGRGGGGGGGATSATGGSGNNESVNNAGNGQNASSQARGGNGATNSGGGGGGGGGGSSATLTATGGSGIVLVRYEIAPSV